ncbi:MAG: agmatinase [Phycisphaerales bacterium]|nr:agmatinase [Phycisphaerales bacterium]
MPRTLLADPRRVPRFAGVCTFCRVPTIDQVAPENRPLDWIIYGAPFDTGTTYRPGARFGPRSIRDESAYVKPYHLIHDVMVSDVLSIADAGDAPVRAFSCEDNAKVMAEFAAALPDAKSARLFAVGGDHSIALPNLRATWERRGKPKGGLALIHLDSHVDTLDSTNFERYSHASPFIRAAEEGLIDPKRMLTIGIKGPLNSKEDFDYARDHGVTIVTCEQWRAEGAETVRRFIKSLGDAETYVTFDVDVVDPAYAPGTGTPSLGGMTSAEALGLLRSFAGVNVVGGDVVEVLPDRDVSGITALLAAHAMFEIISLDAVRRVRRAQ